MVSHNFTRGPFSLPKWAPCPEWPKRASAASLQHRDWMWRLSVKSTPPSSYIAAHDVLFGVLYGIRLNPNIVRLREPACYPGGWLVLCAFVSSIYAKCPMFQAFALLIYFCSPLFFPFQNYKTCLIWKWATACKNVSRIEYSRIVVYLPTDAFPNLFG